MKKMIIIICLIIVVAFAGCGKDSNNLIQNEEEQSISIEISKGESQGESLEMYPGETQNEGLKYNLVEIEGNTYNLTGGFEHTIGKMVQDGMLVVNPLTFYCRVFEPDGEPGENFWISDEEGNRHINEKYSVYEEKINNGAVMAIDAYKEWRASTYRKYMIAIYPRTKISFRTFDKIDENTTDGIGDFGQYLSIGGDGWSPTGSRKSNVYAGIIADGELLDLNNFEDEMQENFDKIWRTMDHFYYYNMLRFYDEGEKSCGYGYADDGDLPGLLPTSPELYVEENREFHNYVLLTTALLHCSELMKNGELSTVVVVTYAWDENEETEEKSNAGIRWDVYMRD